MWYVVVFVAGFVCGALVFRNNKDKSDKIITTTQKAANAAKDVIKGS